MKKTLLFIAIIFYFLFVFSSSSYGRTADI